MDFPPYDIFLSPEFHHVESFESVYFVPESWLLCVGVNRTGETPFFVAKRAMARRNLSIMLTFCTTGPATGPCDEYQRQQHGQPVCPPNDDLPLFDDLSIGRCICLPALRNNRAIPTILYLFLYYCYLGLVGSLGQSRLG